MQMSPAIWIIGPFLYIIFVAIIFALLYLCIKLGVKHGMLAAYEEIEKRKRPPRSLGGIFRQKAPDRPGPEAGGSNMLKQTVPASG